MLDQIRLNLMKDFYDLPFGLTPFIGGQGSRIKWRAGVGGQHKILSQDALQYWSGNNIKIYVQIV